MKSPVTIGGRRELFVDDFLAEEFGGDASLRLGQPVKREVVLETDRPWEGNMNTFNTLLHDGERWRLYYRGWQVTAAEGAIEHGLEYARPPCICVAFSDDGIHWERPELGLYEDAAGKANNMVWQGEGWHGFSPFLDPNPEADPEQRYKAVGVADETRPATLIGLVSADGLRWRRLREEPLITTGAFDSHNTVFFDSERGEYRAYVRDFADGLRGIRTATSPDFVSWSEPEWLEYPGAPADALYTNNVLPYYRAPHLFIGMPARYVERPWSPTVEALPELEHRRLRAKGQERFGSAISDAVLMSSRDGRSFRRWGEAFIRPGLQRQGSWTYGDIYPAWGMVETAVDQPGGGRELSLYASEGYWRGTSTSIRRYSLRLDGFVSLHAPRAGGEWISRPLTFQGDRLSLNVSTSAAGHVRAELRQVDGTPVQGFALDDCWEIVGDTLDYTVQWRGGPELAKLQGQPLRLRLTLSDADLYSFTFG